MTTAKSMLSTTGIAIVATALLASTAGAATYHFVNAVDAEKTVVTGCTFRFGPDGPVILANAGHRATGCEDVWIDPQGFIWLDFGIDNAEECPVISVMAQADETMSQRGYAVGVRSGTHEAKMYLTDTYRQTPLNLNDPAQYEKLSNLGSANVWVLASHYKGGDCK